ncbi:D-alanyl-D-alanine carboxypeptidase [Aurantiacibacter sp. MUD11]|uniref:D-alanyl-D-alanine carboxypeptidase family protein n=1 Tax=Aurantiacibacter sp. MUD11 TaxID=3003265 RepID=UPI0022AA3C3B|nr:D-alanyl-D-alanine carboxypeptidase family protein [Aurantiacibacter sp. MUD11]WAT18341.1 D-alanyl-D-alanine carboxypeptidase [Aurantiacibacter sp. MUD11]
MRYLRGLAIAAAALGLAATPANSAPSPAPVPQEIPVGLLVDLSTGQTLFSREAERRFVPASVTKVMTAYTAFKLIEDGELHPGMTFAYSEELEEAWYNEGSNMFLRAGDQPTIGQLLLGITTVSGNDASVALAVAATGSLEAWLDLMNANARELGMRNTHFGSANGYPDGGQTYTTAEDLVTLARAITQDYPILYRRYFGHRTLRWGDITQANHDPVTGRVNGADGMKTGYTREAGFTFLGSAEREGRRLVMVLAGAPDGPLRDRTARALLEWGFDEFEQRTVVPGGFEVGSAQVQDGAAPQVPLRTPHNVTAAIPREAQEQANWTMEVVYRGPIQAPIMEGDRIARLRLSVDGEIAMEVPLEAAQSVPQANVLQRIANAWRKWTA